MYRQLPTRWSADVLDRVVRKLRRWRLDPLQVLLYSVILLSLALLISGLILVARYRSDRIMPGVHVLGADISGRRPAEATETLVAYWNAPSISLHGEKTTVPVSAAALGYNLDAEATVEAAQEQGRMLGNLGAMLRGGARAQVAPIWSFDPAAAAATLGKLAPHFEQSPQDARLRVADMDVEVIPGVAGTRIDVPGSLHWFQENASWVLGQSRAALVMSPVQPALHDATAAVAQAREMLNNPLYLRAYDPVHDEASSWSVAPEVWSEWVDFALAAGDPPGVRCTADPQKLEDGLASYSEELGTSRYLDPSQAAPAIEEGLSGGTWLARLRVYHQASHHVVEPDETLASIAFDSGFPYPYLQEANPDLGDQLVVGQTVVIPSPDIMLPLPVIESKRIFVSLSEQHLWAYEDGALVWEAVTSTGLETSPTSPGVFQIRSHEPSAYAADWDLLMPNFMGIYQPAPNAYVMNGFHGFPLRDGTQVVWMNQLGTPVTFGCIMLDDESSEILYAWAADGTIVEILP